MAIPHVLVIVCYCFPGFGVVHVTTQFSGNRGRLQMSGGGHI
jgi:hypothetical protein